MYSEDSDIVCVNKTWLNDTIVDSEILHDGYTMFRNDRTHNRPGGVLIAIRSIGFKSVRRIPLPDHLQELEVVSALITTAQDRKVLFCSFYRPPDLDLSWVNLFNSFLDLVCEDFDNMVICGDPMGGSG